mgnify:CR=1 FL=1
MAKKEIITDAFVRELLKQSNIKFDEQGSCVVEIDNALKTASKNKTGKVGFPEFVCYVKDYIIVIEDKADLAKHVNHLPSGDGYLMNTASIKNYAVNGAVFYAKHLVENTNFKKIFAIGVSGNEKNHIITPVFIDDSKTTYPLDNIETFISFNEKNIDNYYRREVLKENTHEKELKEILQQASKLHEDLRNYGNLKDTDKPLVVSGILLALNEIEHKGFSIDNLNNDSEITDGQKIYNAISANLKRVAVAPEVKRDKLLTHFAIIKDSPKLNEFSPVLNKTPLKYFAEFLKRNLYDIIKANSSAEDYLGRFYGEFMSYSGGDGQTLGIILTPKHITELFCDLLDVKPNDIVFDPCCGTGGFLIAAMHKMLAQAKSETEKKNIRRKQLHGIELQSYMFTVATTNMILRGDGKSNLLEGDCFSWASDVLQEEKVATVGMMNPPYSQGSKINPSLYEINFVAHLLDSLTEGGRCAVIVPQSTMTGKTKFEEEMKSKILKNHTLEGVISLQKDTFYGVGTIPCIAIFTAGEPHPADKICKFINFEDDGFKVAPHIGLLETASAKDKKQHLLDVWFDKAESNTKFCVKSTIESTDEWLHSFYYFNDEIPTDKDFEKTVGNYLAFEFSMIMQEKKHLFDNHAGLVMPKRQNVVPLQEKTWKEYVIQDIFNILPGKRLESKNMKPGIMPFIGASETNNGITNFVSNSNQSKDKNVLGVNYNGSVCFAFYHQYECIFSDDVKRFHLKNINDKKEILLFFSTLIHLQKTKFNYGYKFNQSRMNRQKIVLPIKEDNSPDYQYMEQYIENLIYSKYHTYLEYTKHIK